MAEQKDKRIVLSLKAEKRLFYIQFNSTQTKSKLFNKQMQHLYYWYSFCLTKTFKNCSVLLFDGKRRRCSTVLYVIFLC